MSEGSDTLVSLPLIELSVCKERKLKCLCFCINVLHFLSCVIETRGFRKVVNVSDIREGEIPEFT